MNTLTPSPNTLVRKPETVLKQVFGYSEFRDGQSAVIDAAINGQDSLVLLPTGGGKSGVLPNTRVGIRGSRHCYFSADLFNARSSHPVTSTGS